MAARSVVAPTGKDAPAVGAVRATTGALGLTGATVMTATALVVWLPRTSVATAVRL